MMDSEQAESNDQALEASRGYTRADTENDEQSKLPRKPVDKRDRNAIFDSWATRIGALSVLTAAHAYFQSSEIIQNAVSAKSGIIFGIILLSVSCLWAIVSWISLTINDIAEWTVLDFWRNLARDIGASLAMFTATVTISLYSVPLYAEQVMSTLFSWMDVFSQYAPYVVFPAVIIVFILTVFNLWRSKRSTTNAKTSL